MCTLKRIVAVMTLLVVLPGLVLAQVEKGSRNKPERLEWFRDLGFGLTGVKPDQAYEYRAMVKHPLLTVYAEERVLEPR